MVAPGVDSAMLRVEGLSVRFGGLVAVNNVSLTVAEGEIVGLIGPNGAGKTTLTDAIAGLVGPSSGGVSFRGTRINRLPAYRRARLGIARTFQVVRPLVGMSVLENVVVGAAFGRAGQGASLRDANARAEEALEHVGLGHRMRDAVHELTLSDRQMLELARALAGKPHLLILDEVMAGSTATEVSRKVELIQRINRAGLTLIVIEHVMKAVMALSHRIVVLHHGQLIADESPEVVTRDPNVIQAYLGRRYGTDVMGTNAEG